MSDEVGTRRVEPRTVGIYAVAMVVLLIVLALAGDNGVVYGVILLGVPIGSGVLAGLGLIRFWHAVVGCLAIVALDLIFDQTRRRTWSSSWSWRCSWSGPPHSRGSSRVG